MKDRKDRPLKIKVLNSACAIALVGSLIYVVVAGFEALALGAMVLAIAGAATPVIVSGEGILDILLGVVEAIVEGVMAVVEGIIGAISGIFS